jgi:hypothetical protein
MEEQETNTAEQVTESPRLSEEERKQWNARRSRERTARLRALGLNARGKPRKDRHRKPRNPDKQKQYQDNYNRRHKAARTRLGLTIAEFNKLPRATKLMEMKGKAVDPKERNRAAKREWYRQNKDKVMAARRAKALPTVKEMNAEWTAISDNRAVRFCPHCGWNIDATRKAQAFVDGRAS